MSPASQGKPSEAASAHAVGPSAPAVVHPATGEVLGTPDVLERAPGEVLADAYLAIVEHERRLREMKKLLDVELVRRLDMRGRRRMLLGDYELALEVRRESVWDAETLEDVLRRLVAEGVVEAGELTGLIRRETTVSRRDANRLVERLGGDARRAVEGCRSWQAAGSRRLEVLRSAPLLPPSES